MIKLKTEKEIALDRGAACFPSVQMTSRRTACRGVKYTWVRFDMQSDTVAQFLSWQLLQLQPNPRRRMLVFPETRLFIHNRKTSVYYSTFGWSSLKRQRFSCSGWMAKAALQWPAQSWLQAILQCREYWTLTLQKKRQHNLSLITALQRYSCCCSGEWGVSVCLKRLSPKRLPPPRTCHSAGKTCNILTLIKLKPQLATSGTNIWVVELFLIWCAATYRF